MLQRLRRKYSDYAVRAGAIKAAFLRGTAECTWHFDIHPLQEFPCLIENINVAVRCKNEDLDAMNSYADENLLLHLG